MSSYTAPGYQAAGVKAQDCAPAKKKMDPCDKKRADRRRMRAKLFMCWLRMVLAEFLGSFLLVFLAAGASDHIVLGGGVAPSAQVVGVYFAAVLFPLIFTLTNYASGDFNPAISLGAFIHHLLSGVRVSGDAVWNLGTKWAAQFLGALSGAGVLYWFAGSAAGAVTAVGTITTGKAIFLEIAGTAIIVLFALIGRGGIALKSLSMAVLIGVFVSLGAPLSGGSFNFFRTLGPAIVENSYVSWYVYLIGMIGGVAVAVILSMIFDVRRASAAKKHGE